MPELILLIVNRREFNATYDAADEGALAQIQLAVGNFKGHSSSNQHRSRAAAASHAAKLDAHASLHINRSLQ